jgi:hypothetical protein
VLLGVTRFMCWPVLLAGTGRGPEVRETDGVTLPTLPATGGVGIACHMIPVHTGFKRGCLLQLFCEARFEPTKERQPDP